MSVDYTIPTTWEDNDLDWSDCENPNGKPPRNAPLLLYLEAIYRSFIERYEGKYGIGAWVTNAMPTNATYWAALTSKSNADIKFFPMLKLAQAIYAEVVNAAYFYSAIPNGTYSRGNTGYYNPRANPLYVHYVQHDNLGIPTALNRFTSATMLASIGDSNFIEPRRTSLLRSWIGQTYRILNQLRICSWSAPENNSWEVNTGRELRSVKVNGETTGWTTPAYFGADHAIGIKKYAYSADPDALKYIQCRGYLSVGLKHTATGEYLNYRFNRTIPWTGIRYGWGYDNYGDWGAYDASYGYAYQNYYIDGWKTVNVSTQNVFRLSNLIQLDYNGIQNSNCLLDDSDTLADYRVAAPDGFGFRNW